MVSGKISPTTTHAAGPQVVAKDAILKQMNAIMAETAAWFPFFAWPTVEPIMATKN
jgi:hypothetical protein